MTKVIFLKKDVLNNLTKKEKEELHKQANSFWCAYMANRGEKNAFADCLSTFIGVNTGKTFYFSKQTADALCHALNLG